MISHKLFFASVMLGVSKVIVKAHGSSKSTAIYNCVKQAYTLAKNNLCEIIGEEIQKVSETENQ